VHELKEPDNAARICLWLMQKVHDGLVHPQLLFTTEKAQFYISGHVSIQNVKIRISENLHAIQEVP
jgi:hypothetical protein